MNDERQEKRRAYEAASTYYRACYERYYPVRALGGRRPEAMTPEAMLELERLKAAREAARVAWVESARS